jgi:hypothetical protein
MTLNPVFRGFWPDFLGVFEFDITFCGLLTTDSSLRRKLANQLADPGHFGQFLGEIGRKKTKKVCAVTVIVRTFLRYSSMSDIFGLAYLVGQIED